MNLRGDINTLFVRHGILSSGDAMGPLVAGLRELLPGWTVNNFDYRWQAPVLLSGLELAKAVLRRRQEVTRLKREGRILLVGHSQGGLIVRVAVAAIYAARTLREVLNDSRAIIDRPYRERARLVLEEILRQFTPREFERCASSVVGAVTLATPNAGAFTCGQLSLLGRLVAATAMRALRFKFENFPELQSDCLFRVLQSVDVQGARYLSISGSAVNRYSVLNHSDLEHLGPFAHLAPHLDLPNDFVVEDNSVDIRQAPLPSEIKNLDLQYEHIRSYRDCTLVTHKNITRHREVIAEMRRAFSDWGIS